MSEVSKRFRLQVDPLQILQNLPNMDRLMVAARADGFVLERLGVVATATLKDGTLYVGGDFHDAEIPTQPIVSVELDTNTEMRGKVYPRLDFLDGEEQVLFSVVGLEGMEPFDEALSGLESTSVEPRPRVVPEGPEPDLENDPARDLLEELKCGPKVTIQATAEGITQRWKGVIEDFLPAGGCFNVITKDFHLHLPADCLSGWQDEDGWKRGVLLDGSLSALAIKVDA